MNWLKERRQVLEISQEELAARLQVMGIEVTNKIISHWENGRTPPPLKDAEFRHALASTLKLSVRDVLRLSGYEVGEVTHSEFGERAASIVDQLPPDKQVLAIRLLETLAE